MSYTEDPVGRIVEVGWPSAGNRIEFNDRWNDMRNYYFRATGFPPPYFYNVVTGAKDQVLQGKSTLHEFDYRSIPRGVTSFKSYVIAETQSGAIRCPFSEGPFYTEDGSVVTPSDRPCWASKPINPTGGAYVGPSVFNAPDSPPGVWALPRVTGATMKVGISLIGSHTGGSWTVNVIPTCYPLEATAHTVNFVTGATSTDILNSMVSDINSGSSVVSATRVDSTYLQCDVINWHRPSILTSTGSFSGTIPKQNVTGTVVAASPTGFDGGLPLDAYDGEGIRFYTPT